MKKTAIVQIDTDICPNIEDIQMELPDGYFFDAQSHCIADVCPNIEYIQTELPDRYLFGETVSTAL